MKIRIEVDNKIKENEIIIRCSELSEEIKNIQRILEDILSYKKRITFYRGDTEYYLSLEEILFFETEENGICAHTIDNIYNVKYKLYELEEFLPGYFMRVSKSTILNTNHIYSITHSLSHQARLNFKILTNRYMFQDIIINH